MTQCFIKNRERLMEKYDGTVLWYKDDGTIERVSEAVALARRTTQLSDAIKEIEILKVKLSNCKEFWND